MKETGKHVVARRSSRLRGDEEHLSFSTADRHMRQHELPPETAVAQIDKKAPERRVGTSLAQSPVMMRSAGSQALWVAAACALGFASAFLFSDVLALPRRWFLVPHTMLTLTFLFAYARWSGTCLRKLFTRRLGLGLLATTVLGALLTLNVVGQMSSARETGPALWLDLAWLGVVYGAVDALLLSVLPVVAAWRACARLGWTGRCPGRLGAAALGIVASALVTSAYHAGYAEFRAQAPIGKAITGNALMSSAQILTASPVAAVGSHIVMHVAAVLHGPETTVQLPPHRAGRFEAAP